MCTLALSDMGELHDEWLRPVKPQPIPEEVENCMAMAIPVAIAPQMEARAQAAAG